MRFLLLIALSGCAFDATGIPQESTQLDAADGMPPSIDAAIDGPVDAPIPACVNNPNYDTKSNGRRYRLLDERRNWVQQANVCQSDQATLAVINDMAENEIVHDLRDNRSKWLGGSDRQTEGQWRWQDGSAFTYENWDNNEPNNVGGNENCLEQDQNGEWNDNECDEEFRAVCECQYP